VPPHTCCCCFCWCALFRSVSSTSGGPPWLNLLSVRAEAEWRRPSTSCCSQSSGGLDSPSSGTSLQVEASSLPVWSAVVGLPRSCSVLAADGRLPVVGILSILKLLRATEIPTCHTVGVFYMVSKSHTSSSSGGSPMSYSSSKYSASPQMLSHMENIFTKYCIPVRPAKL